MKNKISDIPKLLALLFISAISMLFLTGMAWIAAYDTVSVAPVPKVDGRFEGKVVSHGGKHWGDWLKVDVTQLYSQNESGKYGDTVPAGGPVFGKATVFYKDKNGKMTPSETLKWSVDAVKQGDLYLNLQDWTREKRYNLDFSVASHRLSLKISDEFGLSASGTLSKIPAFTGTKNNVLCYSVQSTKNRWLPQVCDGKAAGRITHNNGIREIKIWSPDPQISVCYKVIGGRNPASEVLDKLNTNQFKPSGQTSVFPAQASSKEVCDGKVAKLPPAYQIEGLYVRHTGPRSYQLRGFAKAQGKSWMNEVKGGENLFLGTKGKRRRLQSISLRLEGAIPKPNQPTVPPGAQQYKPDIKQRLDMIRNMQKK